MERTRSNEGEGFKFKLRAFGAKQTGGGEVVFVVEAKDEVDARQRVDFIAQSIFGMSGKGLELVLMSSAVVGVPNFLTNYFLTLLEGSVVAAADTSHSTLH